jgi:hypothetical protein
MKRTLQLMLAGMFTIACASSALAATATLIGGGGGGNDPPPSDPPPPPAPPPSNDFFYFTQSNGSIGNSTLGANYQAALQAWTDAARQNFSIRGYAWADATMLGMRKNLVIINGMVSGGTSLGTEVSAYLLGQQVFDYKDSFTTAFSKTFSAIDWRNNFWSYTNSWTFLGSGVSIRLALDGGVSLNGNADASALRGSGTLNPRVWADAGGTLSFHLLWITAGSLTGTIHLLDAQGSGTSTIDATALPSGGPVYWTVMGMANLCSGGGSITGCALGKCGTLVSWGNYCPGWAWLSGAASGSI